MLLKKQLLILYVLLLSTLFSTAQIEGNYASVKNFKEFGFGAFLNFSLPVTDANYLTLECGFQYYKNQQEDLAQVPIVLGYRYTLNQTGTGFYVEPNAGYIVGSSSIQKKFDPNSTDSYNDPYEKVSGPAAGLSMGYLFGWGGSLQFNVALRYEHTFSSAAVNVVGLRISHAITFGRRNAD